MRDFAERLAERGDRVWIRHVLVPGFTDDPAEIDEHRRVRRRAWGTSSTWTCCRSTSWRAPKYETLGIPFRLAETPPPSRELVERVKGQFAEFGLVAI